MKEGVNILVITKNEAFHMRKEGFSDYILHGKGTYKKYYIVEEKNALKELAKYRKDIGIK